MIDAQPPPIRKYGLYVLGAGFSAAAGIPMAGELWGEILARGLKMGGRAEKFRRDLDDYIRYRMTCDGVELAYEDIDLEALMGFLDIEHHLGLRGSDTWSTHGNEGQVVIKTLIGQVLSERTPARGKVPDLYVEFARRLRPDDIVITFNYDVLLERALDQAGLPYRLFPYRFKDVSEFGNTVDDSREEIVILKVHGSVDWFDASRYLDQRKRMAALGADPDKTSDAIFGVDQPWTTTPVVDGPRSTDDPLKHLHRLDNAELYYSDPAWFMGVPSLISPSTQKLVYANLVRDFWNGLGRAGGANFKLAIIGYSLPEHDDYARQVLFRVVDNYQSATSELADMLKLEREPILIVDYRTDDEGIAALKRRYAFIDWPTAVLHTEGFDMSVVEKL